MSVEECMRNSEPKEKETKKEENAEPMDPEIEAWLNGEGSDHEDEQVVIDGDLKEENLPDIPEDKECLPVIENNSEVPYHDDGDMCIISDKMVAMMMKKLGKNGKMEEEFDEMEEEEEDEVKTKKQNKNSRAVKKAREERMAAAKKEKEEKLKKEEERLKKLAEEPTSKYNYKRPVKKTNSSLQSLALK